MFWSVLSPYVSVAFRFRVARSPPIVMAINSENRRPDGTIAGSTEQRIECSWAFSRAFRDATSVAPHQLCALETRWANFYSVHVVRGPLFARGVLTPLTKLRLGLPSQLAYCRSNFCSGFLRTSRPPDGRACQKTSIETKKLIEVFANEAVQWGCCKHNRLGSEESLLNVPKHHGQAVGTAQKA